MPLVFICDNCLFEDDVFPWDVNKLERSCVKCGVDGCFKCIPDDVCNACFDLENEDDEE